MQWLVAFVLSEAGFRLITLYQTMHDSIHVKSGQDLPLKLQYIRTEKEAVMGWVCLGVYQPEPSHTAEYADHSTLRNVHCRVTRVAEECGH
jgi:hypothetical protein